MAAKSSRLPKWGAALKETLAPTDADIQGFLAAVRLLPVEHQRVGLYLVENEIARRVNLRRCAEIARARGSSRIAAAIMSFVDPKEDLGERGFAARLLRRMEIAQGSASKWHETLKAAGLKRTKDGWRIPHRSTVEKVIAAAREKKSAVLDAKPAQRPNTPRYREPNESTAARVAQRSKA